jgi:hypothetical protein
MFGAPKLLSIVKATGCNIRTPGHVPLDVESYPIAPDNLVLEQVHVYVRHGRQMVAAFTFHDLVLTTTPL